MQAKQLGDSIEALKLLRKEQQGNVEDTVLQKLDEIIQNLEQAQKENAKISSSELLKTLAAAFELVPVIVKVIELYFGVK